MAYLFERLTMQFFGLRPSLLQHPQVGGMAFQRGLGLPTVVQFLAPCGQLPDLLYGLFHHVA